MLLSLHVLSQAFALSLKIRELITCFSHISEIRTCLVTPVSPVSGAEVANQISEYFCIYDYRDLPFAHYSLGGRIDNDSGRPFVDQHFESVLVLSQFPQRCFPVETVVQNKVLH